MSNNLRVIIADDERPARSLLASMLLEFEEVSLIGEATTGAEAIELIERERPDLALLDLQMPEIDGLGVVRLLRKTYMPVVAFVTAYDEYAVQAFELNAVDYLLKPIDRARLRRTIERASERLEMSELRSVEAEKIQSAAKQYEKSFQSPYLERIPVRQRDEIIIIPVQQVASIVADGELLNITTERNEQYTISYRLKDLEVRLDPARFVRLGRGTLINIGMLTRIIPTQGGTYLAILSNNQQLRVSRLQSRILRDQLLRL
jgi:two-component system LytT family response regulator